MHFEVTHSKMNEGKGYMGETRARVERSYKMLNEVYNSGMFNGGSFGGVGNSMGVLLQRLAVERNECAMLENGLASISNIYLNLDSTLTGNSLMDNVTPDTQLDPDMVESITSVYSGSGDVPGKNGGRHGGGGRRIDSFSRGRQGRGGGSGGGGHLRGAVSREQFEKDYIVVDSMDYLPMSQDLYNRLYVNPAEMYSVLQIYDQDGNPINGLANLHDTLDIPEDYQFWKPGALYIPFASVADALGITSGELLLNYINGDGSDYVYDASALMLNGDINQNFQDNINDVMNACEGNIEDGETIIIANSPTNNMPGCSGFDSTWDKLTHLPTWTAVNIADAGIVCEVTRDGDHYTMNYNYYIIDYYDFDNNPEDLYLLNRYGVASNFVGYGKYSGTIEWDA